MWNKQISLNEAEVSSCGNLQEQQDVFFLIGLDRWGKYGGCSILAVASVEVRDGPTFSTADSTPDSRCLLTAGPFLLEHFVPQHDAQNIPAYICIIFLLFPTLPAASSSHRSSPSQCQAAPLPHCSAFPEPPGPPGPQLAATVHGISANPHFTLAVTAVLTHQA